MRSRLLVTVLAMAVTGLALLALRQQRIASVHEMSRLHHQLDQHRMHLWRLRAQVSAASRPSLVRPPDTGPWTAAVPIDPPPTPTPTKLPLEHRPRELPPDAPSGVSLGTPQ